MQHLLDFRIDFSFRIKFQLRFVMLELRLVLNGLLGVVELVVLNQGSDSPFPPVRVRGFRCRLGGRMVGRVLHEVVLRNHLGLVVLVNTTGTSCH